VSRKARVAESHRFVSAALEQWNASDLSSLERSCELLRLAARTLEPATRSTAEETSKHALAAELQSLRRDVARLGRMIDICEAFHRRLSLLAPLEAEAVREVVEA
jgi:hypothetical protein